MLINILYICTGEYRNFFDKFYDSCEKHFIPKWNKKYYVFTDSEDFYFKKYPNVVVIYIEKNCWPLNTLLRFSYFSKIISDLEPDTYTFFFNANALIVKDVSLDIFRDAKLVGVEHPGYKNKLSIFYPWERRRKSSCYLSHIKTGTYFQGCFNGGRTNYFCELINYCNTMTINDLKRNIIAKVHDESYLNYYFHLNEPMCLSELYAWPEKYGDNPEAIIIMRDKERENWYANLKH
ncbi:hypothetical protein FE392_03555 [Xenorhabdus sp. 12]|uniref:Glycosyl transferase family 6 n=1 Tax=Xenorhabdus santafensis TaxID=2582833 RepID=A0ABU4S5C2_9GAMM|nr:family 6 glucosyltransferase [Xenorhabdus sp. 12]MDX7986412.1 hypothetical protein [Xenorhabdus sp. 12]